MHKTFVKRPMQGFMKTKDLEGCKTNHQQTELEDQCSSQCSPNAQHYCSFEIAFAVADGLFVHRLHKSQGSEKYML